MPFVGARRLSILLHVVWIRWINDRHRTHLSNTHSQSTIGHALRFVIYSVFRRRFGAFAGVIGRSSWFHSRYDLVLRADRGDLRSVED